MFDLLTRSMGITMSGDPSNLESHPIIWAHHQAHLANRQGTATLGCLREWNQSSNPRSPRIEHRKSLDVFELSNHPSNIKHHPWAWFRRGLKYGIFKGPSKLILCFINEPGMGDSQHPWIHMDPLDPHLQQEGRISTRVHPQVQAIGPFTCQGCQGVVCFLKTDWEGGFCTPKSCSEYIGYGILWKRITMKQNNLTVIPEKIMKHIITKLTVMVRNSSIFSCIPPEINLRDRKRTASSHGTTGCQHLPRTANHLQLNRWLSKKVISSDPWLFQWSSFYFIAVWHFLFLILSRTTTVPDA